MNVVLSGSDVRPLLSRAVAITSYVPVLVIGLVVVPLAPLIVCEFAPPTFLTMIVLVDMLAPYPAVALNSALILDMV